MLFCDLNGQVHRVVDRVVGGLEAEDEEVRVAGAGAGRAGLERVEQAAVRGVEPGLRDLAHGPRGGEEVAELDPARGLEGRSRPDPDPGLGDRPEDALGADQRPVRRGPGARARQPAALPGAARGDRPHRLDQVVDVGVEGREVAAGPGRDPAAEGRVLERLREVAEREAVLAELVLEARAGRPGLDPRRQRLGVDLEHAVEAAQVEADERPLAEATLDPADDAGPAAERDHRRALGLAPAHHDLDLRLVARPGDEVGRVLELAAKAAHEVDVGLAERVRDPLVLLVAVEVPESARRLQPRRADLDLLERQRLLDLAPEPEPIPDPGRRLLQLRPRRRLVLVAPAPVLQPPRPLMVGTVLGTRRSSRVSFVQGEVGASRTGGYSKRRSD